MNSYVVCDSCVFYVFSQLKLLVLFESFVRHKHVLTMFQAVCNLLQEAQLSQVIRVMRYVS